MVIKIIVINKNSIIPTYKYMLIMWIMYFNLYNLKKVYGSINLMNRFIHISKKKHQ